MLNAPVFSLDGQCEVEIRESHISRKRSEMPRISCTRRWQGLGVRLSIRKGAWYMRISTSPGGRKSRTATLLLLPPAYVTEHV